RKYIADDALGAFVVSGDQHRRLALAELRLDEVLVADRVERLDHPRLGQRMLDALAERVLAGDRELRREPAREIERIRCVNHDFAAEVGWAGGVDRVLAGVAEHRQNEQFPVRGRLGERAGFDATAIAGEPVTQLGLVRVARSDHHSVVTTRKPGRQTPTHLVSSEHTNRARNASTISHAASSLDAVLAIMPIQCGSPTITPGPG